MVHVVIEGLPGAGKSKLCDALSTMLTWKVVPEPVERFAYLKEFYENPKEWGYKFQNQVMDILVEYAIENCNEKNLITERSIGSCEYFAKVLHKKKYMNKKQMEEFESEFIPDIIVKVNATPETCLKRIELRGRIAEKPVDIQYLRDLDNELDSYITRCAKRGCHVFHFYNENGDFVDSFNEFIEYLCKHMKDDTPPSAPISINLSSTKLYHECCYKNKS